MSTMRPGPMQILYIQVCMLMLRANFPDVL